MKHYYTIPVFIPEKACPYRCIYCNQFKIADCVQAVRPEEVKAIIERYLTTIPSGAFTTIAFFGGSFTGMSIPEQSRYLQVAQEYMHKGLVHRIQLSTRPDYISEPILDNLRTYGVGIVELGAQSLHDSVLEYVGRGHTVRQVEQAAALVRDYGFELGLQMMIGLPTDTPQGAMETAQKIIDWKAQNTRIYPTIVIRDTCLESLYLQGKYTPLSLEQAVKLSADIYRLFLKNGVRVLRVGLHPSEGLLTGKSLVAGPFHVSFKELMLSQIWKERLLSIPALQENRPVCVHVSPTQINAAIGYGGSNKKYFGPRIKFKADCTLSGDDLFIEERC